MPALDDSHRVHEATATADSDGVRTEDDAVTVALAVAGDADRRPGTTSPEHLMAAALAGCLLQALDIAASSQDAEISATVATTVTLETGDGAGYTVRFELVVSGLDVPDDDQLLQQAEALCPFTKAIGPERLTVRRG